MSTLTLAGADPVPVTARPLNEVAYHPRGSAPASVVSLQDAVISAQLQSSVTKVNVRAADRVSRGDVLVELDCRNARAAERSARARLELARYQLQRAGKLRSQDHVSEEILRQRQHDAEVAEAELAVSRVDVERCRIVAPFNGVIQERMVDVGEWVNRGTELLRLVDIESVEVTAEVSALNSGAVARADSHEFLLAGKHYPLSLRAISAVTDASGRTRTVRLNFSKERAAPGESGRLVWREPGLHVPAELVEKRDGAYGILTVDQNRARFVAIPSAQEGRPAPVDLDADVMVITRGRQSVKEGDPVKVVP